MKWSQVIGIGLIVTMVWLSQNAKEVEGIPTPCSYCVYCKFCDRCEKCPCDEEKYDPTCKYCKYCTYCPACSLCDSMCAEGGIVPLVVDALNWVQSRASHLFGLVDDVDLDAVD